MAPSMSYNGCWRQRGRLAARHGTAEGGSSVGRQCGGAMRERERKEREVAAAGENEVRVTLGLGEIRRVNGPPMVTAVMG